MTLGASGTGTTLCVMLDDLIIWSGDPGKNPVELSYDFADDEADHRLALTLSGKTEQNTVVDDQGEISEDLLVSVRNIYLADVCIDQIVWMKSQYYHDFNGSQEKIVDQFFGDMGCNGRIEFCFSTPAYLWILENS